MRSGPEGPEFRTFRAPLRADSPHFNEVRARRPGIRGCNQGDHRDCRTSMRSGPEGPEFTDLEHLVALNDVVLQ